MTTTAIALAKDVHDACRHTNNSILEKRLELVEGALREYERIYEKFPWYLFPHPTSEARREMLRKDRRYGAVHEQQLRACGILAKVCIAAMRANGTESEVSITAEDMSVISVGWDQYMAELPTPPVTQPKVELD